ncbi:aldose 1-epimerase [Klebsiella sp. BIGb0407]|uniref:aldose 1-epimerase n=1 Tax=Klebsiella sp. BIGb0407 TaxID=2940603 RepID=UPI00216A0F38|nr:aldose 1-epimerase [Klebsiella sp. BIGb0407]MCS3431245.1 aldose 1-epimerase [Klebsiella sp. BIGb0407]
MESIVLENDFLRVNVAPQGAAILSLDSLEYQQPILLAGDKALFPMLPLANRVAGNCFSLNGEEITLPQSAADADFFLHGDGWLKTWQVAEHSAERVVLSLCSQYECGFDYQAKLTYRLVEKRFIAELALVHCGSKSMVYGLGFHPYFRLQPDTQVQFLSTGFWPEGEQHLPLAWQSGTTPQTDFTTGRIPENAWLNVGYSGWSGRALINSGAMRVVLDCATPYLMVFRMPDKPFICLEPQSHPVNAHNLKGQPGLILLAQGERTKLEMGITVW